MKEDITQQMKAIMEMNNGEQPTVEQLKALSELLATELDDTKDTKNDDGDIKQTPEELENLKRIDAEKAKADKDHMPFVTVVSMNTDDEDINNGSFELDFNDIFVSKLLKAGYKGEDDYAVVDQWFTEVCKNIAMEVYENDPDQTSLHPTDRREYNKKLDKNRREHR